jgi:multiple sugar transport system substrate-binding protein
MRQFRKIYPVALTFMIGGACGGEEAKKPDTSGTVTFLRHDNPAYRQADDAFFAEYKTAHPTVTVTDTSIDYASLTSRLLADLKTDRLGVDLVRIPPSWVCSFAANLADVPKEIVSLTDAQNTFFPAPLQGSTCNNVLKGLPMEFNLEYGGVVVNVDKYMAKFGKAPSWNAWGDFIEDASRLTEYDNNLPAANGLDIDPGWPQPAKHIFFSQILQRGGKYWSASGDSFDFSTPQAKAAFADMVGWVKEKKVMHASLVPSKNTFVTTRLAKGATGYGWNDATKPLSIIGYVGTWGLTDTLGQIPMGSNTRYDFVTLPPMVGNEHKFVQNSGWALAVPKTSKNQKAAWELAAALALNPSAMRKWSATTGALPALRANGTAAVAMTDPTLQKVQPLLDKGQWVGYIPAAAIETVEGAIVSNFFDAATDKKTLDKALADMQQTANDALARYR